MNSRVDDLPVMNRREVAEICACRRNWRRSAPQGTVAVREAGEMSRCRFGNGERPLVAYPGKRPLIRLTTRPPQLETPFSVFDEGIITPNDAFFVRYHLADIPLTIDPDAFRLTVQGKVDTPVVAVASRS